MVFYIEVKELNGTSILQSSIGSKFITISVMNNKSNLEHAHKDIELIYLIIGELQVKLKNRILHLKSSDFVLVNSNEFHSFQSEKDNLFVVIHFNYSELSSLLVKKNLYFSCNSIEHDIVTNQELRNRMEDLLSVYMIQNNAAQVQLLEKSLKLISTLTSNYLEVQNQIEIKHNLSDEGKNERIKEILDYIRSNYQEPISLEEVANLQYISVAYLSRFIKKQTGKTFSQYLNEVRLAHAVNELINSNKTISRIALDNGFPNLPAFNKAFNETYQSKPMEYRKNNASKEQVEVLPNEVNHQEKNNAFNELRRYLIATEVEKDPTSPDTSTRVETQVIKMEKMNAFTKYWNKLINIGYAKDILNSDMQEQITLLQNEIGFTYARFWGLFADDMHIEDRFDETITYNFSNTNRLLDFLIKNKLKPFIELGPKPKSIIKTVDEIFIIETVSEKPLEEWKKLVRAFLLQCIERYGFDEVETWYFEVCRKPPEIQDDPDFIDKLIINHQDPDQFQDYFKVFSGIKEVIKEIIPNSKVGGIGLGLDIEVDKLDLLLQQWKLEKIQPDFLSFYLYSIESGRDNTLIPRNNLKSTNPENVKNKLIQASNSMKKVGFDHLELNVTEWNMSISSRDYLHDSCFKAAYIAKNIIENLNQSNINMMGYWLCSDIFSDFRDAKNLLHGGPGLITKSGIKKPSFHVYALLKHLGHILVAKGDHYIVTKKSGDNYQVICFNYKHFNYSYYLQPEGSKGIHEQNDIFENKKPLNLSLEIQGIPNGKYRVKEFKLNQNHGSVLDEWIKFGAVDDMKQDEVEHLRQICVPFVRVEHKYVENNSIVLKNELQPHEVRLFEINLLFSER